MPRTRIPSEYGPEYRTLLLTAWEHIQTTSPSYVFHLQTHSQAMVFRRKLHAYFAAIRSAADLKQREFVALRKLTIQLELKVDGACVVFARKRDSWDNVLIRAALG